MRAAIPPGFWCCLALTASMACHLLPRSSTPISECSSKHLSPSCGASENQSHVPNKIIAGSGCREPSTACGSPSSRSLDPIHAISSILFLTVFFLQLLIPGGLNKWKDVYLFMKWQSANYPWQRHHQDWGL